MEELVPLSPEAKAFLEEAKEDLKAIAGKYPALGEWQLSADTKELLEAVTAYLTDLESQAIPPDDIAKEIEGYLPGLKKAFLAPPLPNRFLKQSPDAKFTAHIWLTVLPKLQRFIQDELKAQQVREVLEKLAPLLQKAASAIQEQFEKAGIEYSKAADFYRKLDSPIPQPNFLNWFFYVKHGDKTPAELFQEGIEVSLEDIEEAGAWYIAEYRERAVKERKAQKPAPQEPNTKALALHLYFLHRAGYLPALDEGKKKATLEAWAKREGVSFQNLYLNFTELSKRHPGRKNPMKLPILEQVLPTLKEFPEALKLAEAELEELKRKK